jgi:formylglycine-generating enzyme required for sulfatase activity
MDATAVTNADFAAFVEATGYITAAERNAAGSSTVANPQPARASGGRVFRKPTPGSAGAAAQWWAFVPGADWRCPHGPGDSTVEKPDHPVVQVTYADAMAYARWAQKDLPTEAEWEFAARGGLEGAEYVWGNEFAPSGRHMANTWQGMFPWQDTAADGYDGTAPVRSYPANGFGLYEMAGNVWEWTCDWYRQVAQPDPESLVEVPLRRKVLKGGSYLSSPANCKRYRPAGRAPLRVDAAACDVGFRCVVRPAAVLARAAGSH